ncbi:MerR family transcriptional regulator [Stappia sp.]|uniref:MerR family transcriptional regulator n=1 Tax=Stappia sp. TaxID=1870903 RepID=UPI0032D8E932
MSNDKSPDAFRTISEVAELLDLPQHVLRFWETRFSQIKPLKRGGGRRYYRPEDIDLLRGIRHLLYDEGYTIKGAQRILKEQGARFVMQVWREDGLPLAALAAQAATGDAAPVGAAAPQRAEAPAQDGRSRADAASASVSAAEAQPAARAASGHAGTVPARVPERHTPTISAPPDEPLPRGILPDHEDAGDAAQARVGLRLMERLLGERADPPPQGNLSKDDIRRLQATLFELLECKRILDQAR